MDKSTPILRGGKFLERLRDPSGSQGAQEHGLPFICEESDARHQVFRDSSTFVEQSPPSKRSRRKDVAQSSRDSPFSAGVLHVLPEFGAYRRTSGSADIPFLSTQVVRELVNCKCCCCIFDYYSWPPHPSQLPHDLLRDSMEHIYCFYPVEPLRPMCLCSVIYSWQAGGDGSTFSMVLSFSCVFCSILCALFLASNHHTRSLFPSGSVPGPNPPLSPVSSVCSCSTLLIRSLDSRKGKRKDVKKGRSTICQCSLVYTLRRRGPTSRNRTRSSAISCSPADVSTLE